jgi:hypothetical protein
MNVCTTYHIHVVYVVCIMSSLSIEIFGRCRYRVPVPPGMLGTTLCTATFIFTFIIYDLIYSYIFKHDVPYDVYLYVMYKSPGIRVVVI